VSTLLGRTTTPPPEPAKLKLVDIPGHGTWVKLGEDGADFAHFSVPGNAKIGCHILVAPENGGTSIAYQARTSATDAASRRGFLRYWRFVSPMIGVVMRATLSAIATNAARMSQETSCREAHV
jgi:hypothetical protein